MSSLEEVFLELCIKEDENRNEENAANTDISVVAKPDMYHRSPEFQHY